MQNLLYAIFVPVIGIVAPAIILVASYALFVRKQVRIYFGEGYSRHDDREARRRLRAFEASCRNALLAAYFCPLVWLLYSPISNIAANNIPHLFLITAAISSIPLFVATTFIRSAIKRWQGVDLS